MKAVKDNILKWRCRLHEKYTDAQLRFAFVRYTDFDQPKATRTTSMDFTRYYVNTSSCTKYIIVKAILLV